MGKKHMWRKNKEDSFIERVYMRFDRMNITQVFFFWVAIIVLFGIAYMLVSADKGSLVYARGGSVVSSTLDSIYFSFITATATGFGDIAPTGANKLLSLIEVIIGLTIFAMLTSKLVGIKQERILREIYEISLQEKIHRIRSSFFLYRADIGKVITKIEDSGLRKREVADLWTFANFLEQRILEVVELFSQRRKSRFTKDIDVIDIKLLSNSLVQSLIKTEELLHELEQHRIDWRREVTKFAFEEACKAAAHALETMKHERETGAIKQDVELFEKAHSEIKKILKK